MKKKNFLLISFLLLSFCVASGSYKDTEEKLQQLLSDYQSSPTRTLTTLLEEAKINVDFYQRFWAKLHKLHYLSSPIYSMAKYKSEIPLDVPFKSSDGFSYRLLDLVRFTGNEIEHLYSKIICDPKNEEENNKIFARMDLLLELAKKYYRKMNGIKNRERAKAKIEMLLFVLESVRSNLNYHDQEANYSFLLAVYNEMKLNFRGATPHLKKRVANLFRLFKCLQKVYSPAKFLQHYPPFEFVFLGRKRHFKWLFIAKEPRQEVLYGYYKNYVWTFSSFILDFECLLEMEKGAKELDANHLIRISFFSRLADYIEEKIDDPIFISKLKYPNLVNPNFVSQYKELGRLELYLRRFLNEEYARE
jgi:hypothetical protein